MQPFHNLLSHPGRARERQYLEDDYLQSRQSVQLPHVARRLPFASSSSSLAAPAGASGPSSSSSASTSHGYDGARLPPMAPYPHAPMSDEAAHSRWPLHAAQHAPTTAPPLGPLAPPTRHYDHHHHQGHLPLYPPNTVHDAMYPAASPSAPTMTGRGFGMRTYGAVAGEPSRSRLSSESGHRPSSSSNESTTAKRDVAPTTSKVKRARSTQKITRNRKITSCLQCRERKQKCDRQRPICGNCMTGNAHGGMCTYVDTAEGVQEVLASEGEKDAKRIRQSPSLVSPDRPMRPSPPAPDPVQQAQSSLQARRINLIAATIKAGRDNTLDFDTRVRYARAAAIGTVLFGHPPPSDGSKALYTPLAAVDSLKLPTSAEVGPLLDTYRREIEWHCNVVIIDLNRSRFESFLDWWHSNPQTLPADPPLIPLVLCVLALATQARRLQQHCTLSRRQSTFAVNDDESRAHVLRRIREDDEENSRSEKMRFERGPSPRNDFVSNVSSEKELLETAGRCIDVLQIICPSNWASAFSAPLDLVRANLLRGVWHLSELHLQFAGSCFATTMRLAHAAALNHDTSHWPNMGKEEAQARRNIFWNCAMFERMHTNRVLQPSMILPTSFDTKFPDDYEALMRLFRIGGLIEPYVVAGRRSNIRVQPMSKDSFEFYTACFKLTNVMIQGQVTSRAQNKKVLSEGYDIWREALPSTLKRAVDRPEAPKETEYSSSDPVSGEPLFSRDERRTRYLQDAFLRMLSLGANVQMHRPQVDETGHWRPPEGQAQRSLEVCIESAQRLIWLIHSVVTQNPGPPFCFFNHAIFFCFQAAIVIAIQSVLSPSSEDMGSSKPSFAAQARPSLDKAIDTLDLIASENGLRWVAEQAGRYAATLRDIDATSASQQNRMRAMQLADATVTSTSPTAAKAMSMPAQNMQRPAMGIQPLAIAEGDGSRMGGQGYPRADQISRNEGARNPSSKPFAARKRSSILPPQHLSGISRDGTPFQGILQDSANSDVNGSLRNIFLYDVPQAFGIDFDDLGILNGQAGGEAKPPPGYFADRPIPNVFMNAPPSTGRSEATGDAVTAYRTVPTVEQVLDNVGGDGVVHQSLPWNSSFDNQGQHDLQAKSAASALDGPNDLLPSSASVPSAKTGDSWSPATASPAVPDGSKGVIARGVASTAAAAASTGQAVASAENLKGAIFPVGEPPFEAPQAPTVQHPLPLHASQHAVAPNVETLGETFAMDWNEWERAVEKLLYADRT